MKSVPVKRAKKAERELRVLMGLVELFIETGKPIGSATLKEHGFDDLSSATIRNYFAGLEQEGYLEQTHASGGRIPTALAYRVYAETQKGAAASEELLAGLATETKEVASYLHGACELLSDVTGYPVFLSAPRFDHDIVLDIKVLPLDHTRCLCVMLTDFGSILTETLPTETKLSVHAAKRIESYFTWRLTGLDKPSMDPEEMAIAQHFYNELMVRYITRYSSFSEADLYRTGFSRLLAYPEFTSAQAMAQGLALFEDTVKARKLLSDCEKEGAMRHWIGEAIAPQCAVIGHPYVVNGVPVGAVGILGPMRMPYGEVFGALKLFCESISKTLGKSLGKFKIDYRKPHSGGLYIEEKEERLLTHKETE